MKLQFIQIFAATYTYSVTVGLETHGKQQLRFEEDLKNSESTRYARLAAATHDALDRMVMQSDLRDIYHGVHINEFKPAPDGNGVLNNFYLQVICFPNQIQQKLLLNYDSAAI